MKNPSHSSHSNRPSHSNRGPTGLQRDDLISKHVPAGKQVYTFLKPMCAPLLLLLRLHKLALPWPNSGGVDETNSDSIFCGHFHCLISLPVTSCSFMSACAFKSKPVACNSAFHVRLISDIGVMCRRCFTRTLLHTQ